MTTLKKQYQSQGIVILFSINRFFIVTLVGICILTLTIDGRCLSFESRANENSPYILTEEDIRILSSDFPPQQLKALAASEEKRKELLRQLKEILSLASEARAIGLDKEPTIKKQLAVDRMSVLSQAYQDKKNKESGKPNNPPPYTKEEVDAYIKEPGAEERFRQFLDDSQITMPAEQMKLLKEYWAIMQISGQRAIEAGLDKERKTQLNIMIQQAMVLARIYNENKIDKDAFKATDTEIDSWIVNHPEYDPKPKRAKAEALLKRAKAGANFARLANENTDDTGNKNPYGGFHGGFYEFGRGVMDKTFEDVSFSLRRGEISNIVETPYGYHIIKLLRKFKKRIDGVLQEVVQIRHILVSTMVSKNSSDRDVPLKEYAGTKIEEMKRQKFVDELAIKHKIVLPDDFKL